MELELRQISGLEVRAGSDDGSVVIAGRGIPYGEWSEDLGGFRERLMPSTFRESIADDDIRALFNHNPDIVLGRKANGTLRLQEDERGVHYEVDVNPEDRDAMSAVARIQRGDITGNSFGFYIESRDDQEWEERDGMLWRTIRRARMRELGPQTFPAYPTSDVAVRSATAVLKEAAEWLKDRGKPVDLALRLLELEEEDARLVIGS